MGGYGSGRSGGRPTVESALRLDIDSMMRWGAIQPGCHVTGEMDLNFYNDQIEVRFESRADSAGDGWLRLRYQMTDYWSGEEVEIDDKIYLVTTRPHLVVRLPASEQEGAQGGPISRSMGPNF